MIKEEIKKIPRCCKKRMTLKSSYCDDEHLFYVCEYCGREKIIQLEEKQNESNISIRRNAEQLF